MIFIPYLFIAELFFWSAAVWLVTVLFTLKSGKPSNSLKAPFPQGPTPWPVIGNLGSFSRLFKDPENELVMLAKKYGGICMLWFGSSPVIIINKAEDAKLLLDQKGSLYSDRPSQNSFRERAWPRRLVTTGVGVQFRFLRRVYHNLLGPQQSAGFRKYQDYESKVMINDLIHAPNQFLAHTERFAISVIFSAVYGVRLARLGHPTMNQFYDLWEDMLNCTLLLDYFPILQRLPKRFQPWLRLASRLRKRESALHQALLRTLKQQVKANKEPVCFGTELIKIQDDEAIDDEKAIDILAMLIGAGADTTSSVLQSFFKVMAMNLDAQHAAQKEIDHVVGTSRLPSWDDEPNLPYLRSLIKEVHRWAPIGSLGIPHATSDDDTHLDCRVPKGTIVFPNLTALSRDPAVYANPDTFRPERFLQDDLHANASASHPDFRKRDHFHYGFGRRLCQGIFVAEASLYIAIARVLWAFDITEEPGAPPLDLGDKIEGCISIQDKQRLLIFPAFLMLRLKSRPLTVGDGLVRRLGGARLQAIGLEHCSPLTIGDSLGFAGHGAKRPATWPGKGNGRPREEPSTEKRQLLPYIMECPWHERWSWRQRPAETPGKIKMPNVAGVEVGDDTPTFKSRPEPRRHAEPGQRAAVACTSYRYRRSGSCGHSDHRTRELHQTVAGDVRQSERDARTLEAPGVLECAGIYNYTSVAP
ncbi:cytochrome P450 oxidoreductase [Apiospora arundinis]